VEAFRNLERILRDLFRVPVGIRGFRRDVDVGHAVHAAAVADAEVQIPVGPESEAAAVVLAIDPVEFEQHALGGAIRALRIRRGHPELGQPPGVRGLALERRAGPGPRAVGCVEQAVAREVRVKGERPQAALVERLEQRHDLVAQVEERLSAGLAVGAEDVNDPHLLAEEAPPAPVGRRDEEDGRVEALGHELDGDRRQRLARRRDRRLQRGARGKRAEQPGPSHA